MHTRPLGTGGPRVAPIALGCAGMSDHTAPADEADAIATIHAALDAACCHPHRHGRLLRHGPQRGPHPPRAAPR